ncbi:hypothetical protein NLX83_17520 [Allokutzneria sp. A3M-2-11 16]|uniref:hypothetical protein n=1 Tax=Allokutzneria sp. A3M-2-11 16 TaxID=2962043 RepID=UPI0020B7115B|nr:hypothetical protein [Allokutzneria sp. A3M-2-11 16]MCP3801063.1 hypothetical protein [Allokutzneria sp. A3M-2-11 16]
MAVIFELVINFGEERAAAERAVDVVAETAAIPAGDSLIRLHRPALRDAVSRAGDPYIEFSAIPAGIGWGLPLDRDGERVVLDRAQLSALGHALYDVLSHLDGYQAAIVGWDPEGFVDLAELREDWSDELAHAQLPGLVLSPWARRKLPTATGLQPFADGFDWIPYRGEGAGNGEAVRSP